MTHVIRTSVIVLATALLSACGGGGSGVSSTPAPTPAPTPPPAPTYTKIPDLKGSQTFSNAAVTQVSNGTTYMVEPVIQYGNIITVDFDISTGTYILKGHGISDTFNKGDIIKSDSPNTLVMETRDPATGNVTASFKQITPTVGGVDLSYTRLGAWYTKRALPLKSPLSGQPRTTFMVGGVPTLASDMPKTGTGTFSASKVIGVALDASTSTFYELPNSAVTFSADFAANTVSTKMSLVGTPLLGGADRLFGNFTGTGTISTSPLTPNSFEGVFAVQTGEVASFKGAFFGPAAAEFGYAFDFHLKDVVAGGILAGKQ